MALPVIVVALASAVGGAYLYDLYQKARTKKVEEDIAREQIFQHVARELNKGQTYAVQLMVNPKEPTWGNITDLNKAAVFIQSTLQQLGWIFTSPPKVRDTENAKKFLAGEPTEWIFTARWNRDEKFLPFSPKWAAMQLPYQLPVRS